MPHFIFTDVPDDTGFEEHPPGWHEFEVKAHEEGCGQKSGTPYVRFEFENVATAQKVWDSLMMEGREGGDADSHMNIQKRIKKFLHALGYEGDDINVEWDDLIGKRLQLKIEQKREIYKPEGGVAEERIRARVGFMGFRPIETADPDTEMATNQESIAGPEPAPKMPTPRKAPPKATTKKDEPKFKVGDFVEAEGAEYDRTRMKVLSIDKAKGTFIGSVDGVECDPLPLTDVVVPF